MLGSIIPDCIHLFSASHNARLDDVASQERSEHIYIYIIGSARPTGEIYFTCDLGYYFLYNFVVCVLDFHLQKMCMIIIFVFLKSFKKRNIICDKIYIASLQ